MLSASPISVWQTVSSKRKRRRQRIPTRPPTHDPVAAAQPTRYQNAPSVNRLTYSRRQAAEALGVSITTIDRRVVPTIDTVKTPWGQRLISVDELERFVHDNLEAGRPRPAPRSAGRPPALSVAVVDRVRLEYARGRTLGEIADSLTADEIATAHGGRRWWPSTVRAVLLRNRT